MTSAERHAARRARRAEEREKKRLEYNKPFDDYNAVIDANALIRAAKQSRKGVAWKASVQRYMMNLMRGTWDLRHKLKNGISVVMGFICFTLSDRGKTRNIRSVHFKERVVQRSVSDNALIPVLRRSLVYDNGASLAGKGIHFAIFRLSRQLRAYYRKHKSNDGWILLIDFSGYFDNIEHAPILRTIKKNFQDRHLRWLIWEFIKSFGKRSLGIGSQVSQIFAVAYPNEPDHYAREVLHLGISGRYMDDSYYIHESKEYLEWCLEQLRPRFAALGITMNPKKTHIIPLKRFTFLKVRYYLTATGHVVMKPCSKSAVIMRRKLKSFASFYADGKMSLQAITSAYNSWYGYQEHLDSHKITRDMDKLFFSLFGVFPVHQKKKKKKVHYR